MNAAMSPFYSYIPSLTCVQLDLLYPKRSLFVHAATTVPSFTHLCQFISNFITN